MTELLEMAIERIRALPPERQDEAAQVLLHMAEDEESFALTAEEQASFDGAFGDIEAGRTLTSEQAHAIWSKLRN